MKWIWTTHIERQLVERKIPRKLVESTVNNPDEIVEGKGGRIIYHKMVREKLLRVITEGDRLITAYLTDKIDKYWEGGRR